MAELAIESYDHRHGKPSLIDINNVRMFEGNDDEAPNDYEQELQQPGFTRPSDYSENFELSNTLGSQDCKLKFKKKSQIEQGQLNSILDAKARISINGKTGEREFIYHNQPKQMQGYLQNVDGNFDQQKQIRPSKMVWQLPYD